MEKKEQKSKENRKVDPVVVQEMKLKGMNSGQVARILEAPLWLINRYWLPRQQPDMPAQQ